MSREKLKKQLKTLTQEEEKRLREKVYYTDYCSCDFCRCGSDDGLKLNTNGVYFYICFTCMDFIFDEGKKIKEKILG